MESRFHTTSSIKLTSGLSGNKTNLSQFNYKNGEIITGKVIDVISPDKYVLRIGGKDIIAETNFKLVSGKLYSLKVNIVSQKTSLQIIDPSSTLSEPGDKALAFLKNSNYELTNVNKYAAINLLKSGIPLTRSSITAILNLLESFKGRDFLKNIEDNDLKALIVLKDNGFIVNEKNLRSIKLLISRENPEKFSSTQEISNKKQDPNMFLSENISQIGGGNTDNSIEYISNKAMNSYDLISMIVQMLSRINFKRANSELTLMLINSLLGSRVSKVNKIKFDYNKVYYYFFEFPTDNQKIIFEIFIQKYYSGEKSSSNQNYFNFNILIFLDKADPIRLKFTKKVKNMISILISHPAKDKLEFLKNYKSDLRLIFVELGYISVKIEFTQEETDIDDFRFKILIPDKPFEKPINFLG